MHLATGEPSVPPGEYVYLSCRSPLSNEGFAVEDATMWAPDGRVLAVTVRPASRAPELYGDERLSEPMLASSVHHATNQRGADRGPSLAMTFDVAQIDEVLATTRAVRRRLDLERPVDNHLLLDCIDVAEQAPTGGNLGSRRSIVVREPAPQGRRSASSTARRGRPDHVRVAAERLARDRSPQREGDPLGRPPGPNTSARSRPSSSRPSWGRHDGSGRPGLFDSVIQAAWSFCLACGPAGSARPG